MFTVWFHACSDFKLSPQKQVIRSICGLFLPLKLTKINQQIVYIITKPSMT